MRLKNIVIFMLVVVWGIVIFSASSKTSDESNSKSRMLIYNSTRGVVSVTNKLNITNIDITNSVWLNKTTNMLNKPLRKVAHASIYFVLGIFILVFFVSINIDLRKAFIIAVSLCFLYSLTDEFHQTFVSGRTGQFSDCIIDTSGALLGTGMVSLFLRRKLSRD